MINFSAIENAIVQPQPFPHAIFKNLLTNSDVNALLSFLPRGADQRISRQQGSDKTYSNVTTVLLELGAQEYNPKNRLSSHWINFLDILSSYEYRTFCSKLFGLNLLDCVPEITIRKYQHNDYISAHTDRDCVHATQLIFLNTLWEESWGGILYFMADAFKDHCKFIPHFSSSIMFLRTDNSWHRVSKVTALGVERIAVQIAFWKRLEKIIYEGREVMYYNDDQEAVGNVD